MLPDDENGETKKYREKHGESSWNFKGRVSGEGGKCMFQENIGMS